VDQWTVVRWRVDSGGGLEQRRAPHTGGDWLEQKPLQQPRAGAEGAQSRAGEGLQRVRSRADNGYCAATVVQVGQHRFSTFYRDGGPPAGP
jgi:hypothetical protein